MKTIQEVARSMGYEIRHYTTPLGINEDISKVKTIFDISQEAGGTLNGFQLYNNYYAYPI